MNQESETRNCKLKICGITNLADARFCAGAGADYLGFIQYTKSPRFVSPRTAHDIIEWVYGPETVGVFVNASVEEVNASIDIAGFDLAQLHGDESPWECSQIQVPVIKAFRIRPDIDLDTQRRTIEEYMPFVSYILLDTHHPDLYGGTGASFDWSVAELLSRDFPLFLAGGLDIENIESAIRRVQPFAIDVSSGLEERPGIKDMDKLTAFFDRFESLNTSV
jgi:phosphoribosylanthranilate isomerase